MSDPQLVKTYLVHRTLVQIYLGDITTAEVEAIVNAEHRDLEMDLPTGDSVSAAIRRRGGEEVAEALRGRAPAELGEVVVTHAGALPARCVLHAAVVDEVGGRRVTDEATIAAATHTVLRRADALGVKTIAFPAFGVGMTDIDDEAAARAMIGTVTRYLRDETQLQRVVFALIQPSTFIAFFEAAVRDALARESALRLHVARHNGELEFHFAGDGAVVSKSQVPYDPDEVEALNARLRSLATQAAAGDEVAELRALGRHLYDTCFSAEVKAQLLASDVENLVLRLDESVLHLPWELAHDGQRFLCRRFNLGRQVVLLQAEQSTQPPPEDPPTHLLVAHNPTGDLPGAEREARLLLAHFDASRCPWKVTALGHERLDPLRLALALQEADIVHYSGHADTVPRPGWRLASGPFGAERFARLTRKPRLVFANACHSAGAGPSPLAALMLGHQFLLAGVQSYLGNLWTVPDHSATSFAVTFYDALLAGENFGQALRLARERVAELPAGGAMAWAGYVFYGDPRWRLSR
ncbi:MAG: CHAT domain-containing protein [Fimbriimonadaceae bacterium]|nr:CHAT domain-containing protein [Fimbriimonadaceae bacterium]